MVGTMPDITPNLPPDKPIAPNSDDSSPWASAKRYLQSVNIRQGSLILIIAGFGVMAIASGFKQFLAPGYHEPASSGFIVSSYCLGIIIYFIWGSLGFFWAYRRRVPIGSPMLRESAALLVGLSLMACNWSIAGAAALFGLLRLLGF